MENKWIADRLPETYGEYLVTVKNLVVGNPRNPTLIPQTSILYFTGKLPWMLTTGIPCPFEVLAWMPLPLPFQAI